MCVAATNSTTFAIPFPFSTIANEQKHRLRASLHHLPYEYEPVRIHKSYTVYGISASYEQSHLIIRWEFLYYTFNVYVLLYFSCPDPCPCFLYPLYIYVGAATKGYLFSIYIYTIIYIRFYIYDLRRLRGSYIGSLIIYIRYMYTMLGYLCSCSAASFLALREPRAVGFGLRPWSCNTYTYIVYILYIRITYTINYKFSYFDFK